MYYVMKCKNCGRWCVKQTNNLKKAIFHCKFCNKKFKIKKVNEFGLTLAHKGPFDFGSDAARICMKLNDRGNLLWKKK